MDNDKISWLLMVKLLKIINFTTLWELILNITWLICSNKGRHVVFNYVSFGLSANLSHDTIKPASHFKCALLLLHGKTSPYIGSFYNHQFIIEFCEEYFTGLNYHSLLILPHIQPFKREATTSCKNTWDVVFHLHPEEIPITFCFQLPSSLYLLIVC